MSILIITESDTVVFFSRRVEIKCVCVCDRACVVCVSIQMIMSILIITESDTVVFFSRRVEIKSCVCVW